MSEREFHPWHETAPEQIVDLGLSEEERNLLRQGLIQWGGPARPTDLLAQVIGFADVATLESDSLRVAKSLRDGSSLSKRDWQRALVATEIAWASNFYGAAGDWEITSGWDDQLTLRTLRQLQRRLRGLRAPHHHARD